MGYVLSFLGALITAVASTTVAIVRTRKAEKRSYEVETRSVGVTEFNAVVNAQGALFDAIKDELRDTRIETAKCEEDKAKLRDQVESLKDEMNKRDITVADLQRRIGELERHP